MKKPVLLTSALLVLSLALGACGGAASGAPPQSVPTPPSGTPSPSPAPQKGFITGRALSATGQPLQGVEIDADNTLADHSNLIGYTDAGGNYRLDVSLLPTTWYVRARLKLKYGSYTVAVDLVPDTPDAVPGLEGGVRNFTFKPKEITPEDPYGNLGAVTIDEVPGEFEIDFSKVVVTLTPVGALADGTTGTTRTLHLSQTNSGWMIPNVMWGTYTVTATLDGQPLHLRRRATGVHDYPWSTTYQGGFYVDYSWLLPNMFLEAAVDEPTP